MPMGRYAKLFAKITISDFLVDKFMENYAIMPSLKGIGFRNVELILNIKYNPRGIQDEL